MPKQAVPVGFCKTCRWARELDEILKVGPLILDCQALPFVYQRKEEPTGVAGPDGEEQISVSFLYLFRPHTERDFCGLYEKIPDGSGEERAPADSAAEGSPEEPGS